MGLYAVVKGDVVDGITIADAPLDTDGIWVDVTNVTPPPGRDWKYIDGVFSPPPPSPIIEPPKTDEEKLADAISAAVAKLIADGVLKQA